MSLADRAAQFSPFAALTGYDDLITESARWTMERPELDESEKERLGRRLRYLFESGAEASFLRFVPDGSKPGGAYCTEHGILVRYDGIGRTVTLDSGLTIPVDDILGISSDAFDETDIKKDPD